MTPERREPGSLERALGIRVVTHEVVGSTMDAARNDPGDLPVVHVAERQVAGRGRHGRRWESPPGNLHATLVWPDPRQSFPPAILAAIQVAWAEAIRAAGGPRAQCKWPNDGFIEGRKWAGMIAVREGSARRLSIGLGANLVVAPADEGIVATTLAAHWPAWPGRHEATTMLLGAAIEVLRNGEDGVAERLARWADHDVWAIGTPLEITVGGGTVRGTYAGLSKTGAIRLSASDGDREVASGEARRVRQVHRP